MYNKRHWPTPEEIKQEENKEQQLADEHDEEANPICECGRPGWACWCEELEQITGTHYDGTPIDMEI